MRCPAALRAASLAAVVFMLPVQGEANVSFAEQVLAHAPAVVPAGVLVFGLPVLAANPRLLLMGATGLPGSLPYRPNKQFASGPADAPLASLFLAEARRICAAAALHATPALWMWPFSWPLSPPPPPVSSPSSPAPPEHFSKKVRGRRTSCS